jgi:HSP90 family molecular chaperone
MVKLQSSKSTSSSSSKEKADKTEKDKREKLIDEIKEYLKSNDENAKLNNEIKDAVRIQNTYIDYIIYKLPSN